jgi:hypothetical protein
MSTLPPPSATKDNYQASNKKQRTRVIAFSKHVSKTQRFYLSWKQLFNGFFQTKRFRSATNDNQFFNNSLFLCEVAVSQMLQDRSFLRRH